MDALEANAITPRLWLGSVPPRGSVLSDLGFTVVVLCAREYQYTADQFPGVRVIHAPLEDNYLLGLTDTQLKIATQTGHKVADALFDKETVLVTCQAGINRSSFVTAVALHALYGVSGPEAIMIIRGSRWGTLQNPRFVELLNRLPENKETKLRHTFNFGDKT